VRLLLDEMYPLRIADELQRRGHDVLSVHERPGRGTPDSDVFEFASEAGRALVTENVRDFRPLASARLEAGNHHAGLVLTASRRWPRDRPWAIIDALEGLLRRAAGQPIDGELWL